MSPLNPHSHPETHHFPTYMLLEMPISFRLARQEDVDKLEWFGQFSHFRRLIRHTYREQLKGKRLMLLADFNGFPIGQVFIQLESTNFLSADGVHRAYLYSFRVMQLFQGRGIGTRLLHEAEQLLIKRGFNTATLSVAKTNPNAIRLYLRSGYDIVDEDDGRWSYFDHRGVQHFVEEPCWVLEKYPLSNGSTLSNR
jgi:ribosomal protein S18 acetylase RimI-like enzyme